MEAFFLLGQFEDAPPASPRGGEEPIPLCLFLLPPGYLAQGCRDGTIVRFVIGGLLEQLWLRILTNQGLELGTFQKYRLALWTATQEMSNDTPVHRRLQSASEE